MSAAAEPPPDSQPRVLQLGQLDAGSRSWIVPILMQVHAEASFEFPIGARRVGSASVFDQNLFVALGGHVDFFLQRIAKQASRG